MSTRSWSLLVAFLAIVIIVLIWFLFTTPAAAPTISSVSQATTTMLTTQPALATPSPGSASSTAPLDTQVVVASPAQDATVPHTFTITGSAPNQWFYEAVFPIQVRDPNDNLIGTSQGQAQGDWTQPGIIGFTSQMKIDASYEGPANLIVLKDNPSGLPQNIDSVTIPIVVQ